MSGANREHSPKSIFQLALGSVSFPIAFSNARRGVDFLPFDFDVARKTLTGRALTVPSPKVRSTWPGKRMMEETQK